MKKIVVTGGLGFIGLHLVKYLLENKNCYIFILDRTPVKLYDKAILNLLTTYQKRFKIIFTDLEKVSDFPQADEVYHLAGGVGSKIIESESSIINNSRILLENILKAYNPNKTRQLFISSTEIAGNISQKLPLNENCAIGWTDVSDPRWRYSISKFIYESIITNYPNLRNYNIARLSNTYGERMKKEYVIKSFIKKLLNNEVPFTINYAHDTRSFTYISDIIIGLVKIMESEYDKQIFNLGTQTEISILDLALKLHEIAGKDKSNIYVSKIIGKPDRRLPDISKAKKYLNWAPKVALEIGLKKTYNYYKNDESTFF